MDKRLETGWPSLDRLTSGFLSSLREAEARWGATRPNPPVGAALLDPDGQEIATAAHVRHGFPHAEVEVVTRAISQGCTPEQLRASTLIVTLEPCSHQGRTPPCTQFILNVGIPRVIYAVKDTNPGVEGGGAQVLAKAGVEVRTWDEAWRTQDTHPRDSVTTLASALCDRARRLSRPFLHWAKTGRPWVVAKIARRGENMIPPVGQKTFTSERALRLAHLLRRRSDVILTGSGTVLADHPLFTVRRLPDFSLPDPARHLAILDRRLRVPQEYLDQAGSGSTGRSQTVRRFGAGTEIKEVLDNYGRIGCHQLLVEAGPELTEAVLSGGFCNETVIFDVLPQETVRIGGGQNGEIAMTLEAAEEWLGGDGLGLN